MDYQTFNEIFNRFVFGTSKAKLLENLKILLKILNAIWGFLDPLSLKQNYYKIY